MSHSCSHNFDAQIAAADKQLKSTRQFLEEQAAERELERDEFVREIQRLTDALKVKERDSSLQDRMSLEVSPFIKSVNSFLTPRMLHINNLFLALCIFWVLITAF